MRHQIGASDSRTFQSDARATKNREPRILEITNEAQQQQQRQTSGDVTRRRSGMAHRSMSSVTRYMIGRVGFDTGCKNVTFGNEMRKARAFGSSYALRSFVRSFFFSLYQPHSLSSLLVAVSSSSNKRFPPDRGAACHHRHCGNAAPPNLVPKGTSVTEGSLTKKFLHADSVSEGRFSVFFIRNCCKYA